MQIIYVPLTAHASDGLVVTAAPEDARRHLIEAQQESLLHLHNLLNSGDEIIFSDKIVTSEGTFAVFILHPILQPIGG